MAHMSLNNCEYHFEERLRFMMLLFCLESGATVLVTIRASTAGSYTANADLRPPEHHCILQGH